nr:DUF3364 domain-containing protein [Methylacidiphilum kamchatkense]
METTEKTKSQNADNVLDHFNLFRQPQYLQMFEKKKCEFENPVPAEEVEKIREWTKSWEYRRKKFRSRSHIHKSFQSLPTPGSYLCGSRI